MLEVVNFKITPYDDDVVDYIDSLSAEDIYYIFLNDESHDVLTAALFNIYRMESDARNILLKKKNINTSYPLIMAQRDCPDSYKSLNIGILNALGDVYMRDQILFSENLYDINLHPNVFVLVIDGVYSGHVYAWKTMDVTNVIGIRTSIYQLLIDKCKLRTSGVAAIFMDAIHKWAKQHPYTEYIRVLQPIGQMPHILSKCGFTNANKIINREGLDWMYDNKSIGPIPFARPLLFRDDDYINNTIDGLLCFPPKYKYRIIY